MEKPTINYAVAYQRFRSDLNGYIVQLQKEYPIRGGTGAFESGRSVLQDAGRKAE